jgi:hypothetical protein
MKSKEKRKISVGFLNPSKLEKDTIYVTLKRNGPQDISIQVISNSPFKHTEGFYNLVFGSKYGEVVEVNKGGFSCSTNSNDDMYYKKTYESFLKRLLKDNKPSEINYNFESDGFILQENLIKANICLGKLEEILRNACSKEIEK